MTVLSAIVITSVVIGIVAYEYVQTANLQLAQSNLAVNLTRVSNLLTQAQLQIRQQNSTIIHLKESNNLLQSRISQLVSNYYSVKDNSTLLLNRNSQLTSSYYNLQSQYNQTSSQLSLTNASLQAMYDIYLNHLAGIRQQELQFFNQTGDVHFHRLFILYDYKTNETHIFHQDIPFKTYAAERSNLTLHAIPYQGDPNEGKYYQLALSRYQELDPLATFIRSISGNDDELYANLALQVSYQMDYAVTDYTKMPLEPMVEDSGDCKSHAIFVTSLLKAGGINATLLIGRAIGSPEDEIGVGHAIVGIPLSEPPSDIPNQSWHYDINGTRYYVAETTWPNGLSAHNLYYPPVDSRSSVVGDLTWINFKLVADYFVSSGRV